MSGVMWRQGWCPVQWGYFSALLTEWRIAVMIATISTYSSSVAHLPLPSDSLSDSDIDLSISGTDDYNDWLKVPGYRAGVVFLSTSTASSYCTVVLSELKTTQYGASHTGKHFKRREIRNSRGCGVTEAATKRFFSSGIWTCAKDPAPPLTVTVRTGHL